MGNEYGCKICRPDKPQKEKGDLQTEIYDKEKDDKLKEQELMTEKNNAAGKIQNKFRAKRNKKTLKESKLYERISDNAEAKGMTLNKTNEEEFESKLKQLPCIIPIREKFKEELDKIKYEGEETVYDLPCIKFEDKQNDKKEYYKGQWNNKGELCGKVKTLSNNNTYYEGIVKNNVFNGKGLYVKPDGSYYFGDWDNGKCQGEGELNIVDNSNYKGQFNNNCKNGKGKEEFSDKSTYEGDYVKNEKKGQGKLVFPDGSYYEGEFADSVFNGKGIYHWKDGRQYEGDFKNGLMDGHGKYIWTDKSTYEGSYIKNKKCGDGIFFDSNQDSFSGKWINNKPHGNFTLITKDQGNNYDINFRNGKIISSLLCSVNQQN